MRATKSYQESLVKSLRDPVETAEYLNAAIEENNLDTFLLALRNVAQAHSMSRVSQRTKLNRVSLYRMLSRRGNPQFQSILNLLNAWGLKLAVRPQG